MGKGRYTSDINLVNQTHAVFLRSDVPHGAIKSIDTAAAAAVPGVMAIFMGEDFAEVGENPAGWAIISRDGELMKEPKRPVLVHGKVRHVGDAHAAVIAETVEHALDAADAVAAEIEELPAVVDMSAALAVGPFVHDKIETNQCSDWGWIEDNRAATDAAIKNASHVTMLELINNRLVPIVIETRASNVDYDPGTGEYTLYTISQNPHLTRLLISAFVMGIAENKLCVVSPDFGGGFGLKIYHYGEEVLVLAASKKLCRPVKWTATRSESFLTDAHGRDNVTKIELACEKDGTFIAFRTDTMANLGAYLSNFSTDMPTFLHGTLMAGKYTVPHVYVDVKTVFTNIDPVDSHRGAGRPEAMFSIERVIDKCAHKLGFDAMEVRRKNFIKPNQLPYVSAAGLEYDTGNYDALVDKLNELADFKDFEVRCRLSEVDGKLRGIGINTYNEACGLAPSNLTGVLGSRVGCYDAATVRVNATGNLSVMAGAQSTGQGHETSFAQVVLEMLGIDQSSTDIVYGDMAKIPFGMGSYGLRSIAVCGPAVVRAIEKIINKVTKIAAHMLETAEADIEFKDGQFSVAGTDKSVSFGEVAFKAHVPQNYPVEDLELGLEETAFYDPGNFTYPSGAYACEVEVDPETGKVTAENFTAVDSFGNVVNPMIVTGQIHGGIEQGIGQALLENCAYYDNGQLLSASYMEYGMLCASDLPFYTLDHSCNTLCTHNPLWVNSCGEAGAIGPPPTIMNAAINALHSSGHSHVMHIDMPV